MCPQAVECREPDYWFVLFACLFVYLLPSFPLSAGVGISGVMRGGCGQYYRPLYPSALTPHSVLMALCVHSNNNHYGPVIEGWGGWIG